MFYDLIIVACTKNDYLRDMTQRCIDSVGLGLNVILVETSNEEINYKGVNHIVRYTGQFRYNHALNQGLQYATSDVHILANNDLVFYPGWEIMGEQMIYNGFDSASAWYRGSRFAQGDYIYEGYDVAVNLTGWCIFITQEALRKIGKLDDTLEFWYSDNAYALQLLEHGLRHGLFCNVRIDHLTSQTLRTITPQMKRRYSHGSLSIFNKLCEQKK